MDGDPLRRLGEIDPVIFSAIAVEFFSFALDHAEMLGVEMVEVFGQNLKLLEEVELHSLRQRRHLGRTQLVENDLEHCCSALRQAATASKLSLFPYSTL